MNFNTFSSLYSVSNATASFSGSGHNSALVQAAQNYGLSFTIVTGSNVGDTLQVTSSLGSIITGSSGLSTSSFNRTTASFAISDATPFQSVLIQGTIQGTDATTSVTFASPISGSQVNVCDISACHITSSGNISASGDIFANDIVLEASGVTDKPNVTLKRAGVTGAELKMGDGGNDDGILHLSAPNGTQAAIRLQGGGISYFSSSLKINVPYVYPENNPATLTVGGAISASGNLTIDGSQIDFTNLPTSDPGVVGRLYRDGGTVKISI